MNTNMTNTRLVLHSSLQLPHAMRGRDGHTVTSTAFNPTCSYKRPSKYWKRTLCHHRSFRKRQPQILVCNPWSNSVFSCSISHKHDAAERISVQSAPRWLDRPASTSLACSPHA